MITSDRSTVLVPATHIVLNRHRIDLESGEDAAYVRGGFRLTMALLLIFRNMEAIFSYFPMPKPTP
jgi:hypothetical protein